jgi:hypothetical protein
MMNPATGLLLPLLSCGDGDGGCAFIPLPEVMMNPATVLLLLLLPCGDDDGGSAFVPPPVAVIYHHRSMENFEDFPLEFSLDPNPVPTPVRLQY